ncbi:uncharacterized protein Dana_GF13014, isoform C [Drosophila ananassae]|uniref:tRNA-queuosine alpha-mannosyltransferase n=1 Tax=Drosophila ananassae TaxID=7217 RepID=B3MED4_DROAN|nr:glycosyltransferase-like domain-containing protein 1-like isoform X1 [Drosophila ananassae]EDV36540.2 uncharacterized protein Dana_GF13014, isoform C [Drosophila ananassae]
MEQIRPHILIIEPFYGGSHKQLISTLVDSLHPEEYEIYTLPAKKWHWRARSSALYFSQVIPQDHSYRVLFTSSVLSLAELIGIRPDLATCRKVVYFHENQLIYPVREVKERDCQYGLNEILTCLAADLVLFNSHFNRSSFLDNVKPFLNIQPDFRVKNIREKIESKCEVLYFPINFKVFPDQRPVEDSTDTKDALHLVWPHRWEHDKNPELLVEVLLELVNRNADFQVTICGESYQEVPEAFDSLKEKLGEKLINFGHLTRDEYVRTLLSGDIVISTAIHEFYGVAMLEAAYCGCYPLAPNKLVYPEIYPKENLYNTTNALVKMLSNWCRNPTAFRRIRDKFRMKFSFEKYSAQFLVSRYFEKMNIKELRPEKIS